MIEEAAKYKCINKLVRLHVCTYVHQHVSMYTCTSIYIRLYSLHTFVHVHRVTCVCVCMYIIYTYKHLMVYDWLNMEIIIICVAVCLTSEEKD